MNSKQSAIGIDVRPDLGLLILRAGKPERLESALSAAGCAISVPGPLQSQNLDNCVLRWLTPDEWLLSGPDVIARREPISQALGDGGAVVDVSGGYVVMELAGAALDEVLARLTVYDADPVNLPAGKVVGTLLGKSSAWLRRIDEHRVEWVVRRSFADYAWRWISNVRASYALDTAMMPARAGWGALADQATLHRDS